jgi:predicted N-acyltransferase
MYDVRLHPRLADVPAEQWDALHDGCNPFVTHGFLSGLEQHGCLRPDWGWTPRHLTLWNGDALVAAAPMYLKENSHGEFVFDHAWARSYAQHGLDYFPKWLCAVPYSPVTGPRLLARDDASRRVLLATMARQCKQQGLSSVHVNFLPANEDAAFTSPEAGGANAPDEWLLRTDIQYHWHNAPGWRTFGDFLAALDHKHRKNIRQERAKVATAGVTFRVVEGADATDADLSAMHHFYERTFAEYGNHPALTLAFLRHLAASQPESLVLFLAQYHGQPVAGALCLRGGDTLYGRYWGSDATLPGLHFETCYYQGIEYCLRHGLTRFEPGAQGEHKLARGFLPTLVHSRHWIAHDGFRTALAGWCREETVAVQQYARRLGARSPFKVADTHTPDVTS